MSEHPNIPDIPDILSRWPSRQAIADDAGVDLFAVHRWFQRGSIPGKHDACLLAGAASRSIALKAEELVVARSHHGERTGHAKGQLQEAAPQKLTKKSAGART